ncbi:MAG: DUF1902 domain-containing protein [Candidatus Binataceae bacterium]|nr:DUF1902 domain-containing protein [Candidatus Binataceae bacterium]
MAETTPINNELEIDAVWDDAAEVWVVESDGVPGLVTEADSRVTELLRRSSAGLRARHALPDSLVM